MDDSLTLWTCRKPRWQLRLDRNRMNGKTILEIYLAGVYEGLYRQRSMPPTVFRAFLASLDRSRRRLRHWRHRLKTFLNRRRIAAIPQWTVVGHVDHECFHLQLGHCRESDGRISDIIAVYDQDDREAPVLYLTDGEIEAFLDDLHELERRLNRSAEF